MTKPLNVNEPVQTRGVSKSPKRIQGWVNWYPNSGSRFYKARADADMNAFGDRIACIYVDFAEGEGL